MANTCDGTTGVVAIAAENPVRRLIHRIDLLGSNAPLLTAAMVGATPAPKIAAQAIARRWPRVSALLEPVMLVLLLLLCTAFLVDGSYNPFLYFRF